VVDCCLKEETSSRISDRRAKYGTRHLNLVSLISVVASRSSSTVHENLSLYKAKDVVFKIVGLIEEFVNNRNDSTRIIISAESRVIAEPLNAVL